MSNVIGRDGAIKFSSGEQWSPQAAVSRLVLRNNVGTTGGAGWKVVPFDTKDFDPLNSWTTGAGCKFQPTIPGYYEIDASVQTNVNNANVGYLAVSKNGTTAYKRLAADLPPPSTAANLLLSGSTVVYLNGTTDYIQIVYYWGGDWTFNGIAAEDLTSVSATLVGTSVGVAPEPWTPITSLSNGWGVYQPVAYFKDPHGIVRMRGELTAGTWTAGTIIFNLPAGYRPAQRLFVPVYMNSSPWSGVLSVQPNGNVLTEQRAGTATHIHGLDPIQFRAEQ